MKPEEMRAELDEKYPLVPHTNAGRLFSTVRRMKAEKALGMPVNQRTGFAISTESGKSASKMTESEWEEFYAKLSSQLKDNYPDLYVSLFEDESTDQG